MGNGFYRSKDPTNSIKVLKEKCTGGRCCTERKNFKIPVMLSPRGQSGLEAKIWPRPRPRLGGFGLGLASISLSYYVIGYFSCKNRVKFGNFVKFSCNNLKSMLLIWHFFHNYFWSSPRPRPHSPGLGLEALASASASRFWRRLTSLQNTATKK